MASALPGAGAAQEGRIDRRAPLGAYDDHIAEAAARFRLPKAWISAVMRAESGGNSRAVSAAGAMGLMQIMPATWVELTARHTLGADPFDPRANTLAGAAYLREMLDRYGDLVTALAAYNAGPRRVDDYRVNGRPLPGETSAYVARIIPDVALENGVWPFRSLAANALAWRSAELFIARDIARPRGGAEPMGSRPMEVLPDRAIAQVSPAPQPLLRSEPHASGLFVPPSGRPAQ